MVCGQPRGPPPPEPLGSGWEGELRKISVTPRDALHRVATALTLSTPVYTPALTARDGWQCTVVVPGAEAMPAPASGAGRARKQAENAAAMAWLRLYQLRAAAER